MLKHPLKCHWFKNKSVMIIAKHMVALYIQVPVYYVTGRGPVLNCNNPFRGCPAHSTTHKMLWILLFLFLAGSDFEFGGCLFLIVVISFKLLLLFFNINCTGVQDDVMISSFAATDKQHSQKWIHQQLVWLIFLWVCNIKKKKKKKKKKKTWFMKIKTFWDILSKQSNTSVINFSLECTQESMIEEIK